MKKATYHILSHIPFAGFVVQLLCDPMLFSTPMISEGLPTQILDYMEAHPDTVITRRLFKEIMGGKK